MDSSYQSPVTRPATRTTFDDSLCVADGDALSASEKRKHIDRLLWESADALFIPPQTATRCSVPLGCVA